MSAVLRGTVTARNRDALIAAAFDTAVVYFGEKCLDVVLRDEVLHETTQAMDGTVMRRSFEAGFSAAVAHKLDNPMVGTGTCRKCGAESWPDAPLPQRLLNESEGERA